MVHARMMAMWEQIGNSINKYAALCFVVAMLLALLSPAAASLVHPYIAYISGALFPVGQLFLFHGSRVGMGVGH